jgi:DNA-binding transcriptional MerR regulator
LEARGVLGIVSRTPSGARRYSPENLARIAESCAKAKAFLGDDALAVERVPLRPGLTVGEAGKAFGVHVRTIQRWEKEGKLGPLPRDVRGVRRFRPQDLGALEQLVYGGVSRKPPWLAAK